MTSSALPTYISVTEDLVYLHHQKPKARIVHSTWELCAQNCCPNHRQVQLKEHTGPQIIAHNNFNRSFVNLANFGTLQISLDPYILKRVPSSLWGRGDISILRKELQHITKTMSFISNSFLCHFFDNMY